ncbi:MAG: hypothetical protein H8E72_01825 [Candidatus Marinimicrobia bacterium]|nr:hypothetical protein [Candidatus Neomarinimicrobiota bacterium]
MGSISSITEDSHSIYILADNGIFTVDKSSGDIEYSIELSDNFHNPQIIYYDEYSDYFWLITQNEIYIKSSVGFYWKSVYYSDLGFDFRRTIYDIGSSPSYIWLDMGTQIIPVYPIGIKISDNKEIDESEINLINWGHYSQGRSGELLDISQYIMMDDWNVGLKYIKDSDGNKIHPTVKLEDSNGEIWIGTKEGILLKGWIYSQRLEILLTGPDSYSVTVSIKDNQGNWWFGDSPFKRKRKKYDSKFSHNRHILSHWYEYENKWNYMEALDGEGVSFDIHNIQKVGPTLYISTLDGLLIYDYLQDELEELRQKHGLKDDVLWDLSLYKKSLYIATKFGISEVSTVSNTVIPNKDNWIEKFDNIEIYDIETDSVYFYVSSANGLFKISHENEGIKKISSRKFKKIQIMDEIIWGLDFSLWWIDIEGNDFKHEDEITDFFIYEDFVWATNGSEINLSNSATYQEWNIPLERGMEGAHIYSLSCDDEWVWFLTNKGIIFYNWTTYNNAQN